ncbi:MAG TPA: hydroxyacid-oxoacid transhydrogenase [Nakamurella sp.]|nr:hydroxyacid-oxoacid transhydrogenase [Nakamurella sp.]
MTARETVFTWGAPPVKFGAGALQELGSDVAALGARRALVLTDPHLAALGVAQRAVDHLAAEGVSALVYDQVQVEPTDASIAAAVQAVGRPDWDVVVAVGGGSSIDTAKVVNLLTCYPAPILDYVNKPVGRGLPPPGPLRPLVAVPTTAGTGSESTPVCVLDILELALKTGISHPALRPVLAVLDPELTMTLPPAVTAASGMDVICHALESFTARPYTGFSRHPAGARPSYCGSNPISDQWAARTLSLAGSALPRAVRDGSDVSARTDMLMAAMFAGMGFGNAGVHIPHACAYPIAGRVRGYRPAGYPVDEVFVPHGQAVSLTAAAAFRATFAAAPERHQQAAALLAGRAPHMAFADGSVTAIATGTGDGGTDAEDHRDHLPRVLTHLMRTIGIPNGLHAVGYGADDIPTLVDGALRQQRLTAIAPIEVHAEVLRSILLESLAVW